MHLIISSPVVVVVVVVVFVIVLFGADIASADDVGLAIVVDNDDNDEDGSPSDFTFIPIDNKWGGSMRVSDYQSILFGYTILIDPSSPYASLPCTSAPNTMFTIFPSKDDSRITVETSPPNLVTAKISASGDALLFKWNTDVSSTATSGGVRIGIPTDQLRRVNADGGHNVQILDGFTNITSLKTGLNSTIRASMTSAISTYIRLWNWGGQMYVQTNITVDNVSVFAGGQTWVEIPSINSISVMDNGSELNIKGDIDDRYISNEVSDGAQLTVTGTITGTVDSLSNSTVNAPSCDNVTSSDGSTCNAGPQSVDVDIGDLSQKSQILTGTYTCGGEVSSSVMFAVVVVAVVTATLI